MTDAEALARIEDIMSCCILVKSEFDELPGHDTAVMLGLQNARTLIRLLQSDGWGWIRLPERGE